MKKIIITSVLTLLVLVGCSSNESDAKPNFMDEFKLDLSGWELDLTKPYIQNYATEIQRDSIIGVLSQELFEANESSIGKEESKIVLFSFDFSADAISITNHLIANEEKMDELDWNALSVCLDENCLNRKIIETLAKNPSAAFIVKKDLYGKEVQLISKLK